MPLETPGKSPADLALVMSGGGARAAYQVGLLMRIARAFPKLEVPILTGVSAGAVNAAQLGCLPGTFLHRLENLYSTWQQVTVDRVCRVAAPRLLLRASGWGVRLVSGGHASPEPRGLMDTQPLREFLRGELGAPGDLIPGIQRNIESGVLRAVAITASSYSTGRSVSWVQSREGDGFDRWERSGRVGIRSRLRVDHVMASSALPFFFPAVEVDGEWFGDGGIRLTSPFSPAVHLGASRILAISTRYGRSIPEARESKISGYPPPAQVAGALFNAIFLDLFDGDAMRMERVNQLLRELPEEKRQGMKIIRLLVLRPSKDLGTLANKYEARLPRALRFLTRGLGTRETRSNDLLSLLMFQPDYLQDLLDLGYNDAEERMPEIRAFLETEEESGTAAHAKSAEPAADPVTAS
jgi:NTE family protein